MEEKIKKKHRPSILSRDPYKRRTESEMIKIVKEVNSGMIGKRAACSKYGLNRNTLARFIKQYAVRNLKDEVSIQLLSRMTDHQKSKAIDKKVNELTQALELAQVKD